MAVITNLNQAIRFVVVILCCTLSFSIRLFSNVSSEPIIHEFDPHFNWRCTQYIHTHGLYEFLGWFDNISWYPQGRPVGETAYPGLMYTSAITKWALQKLHIMVSLLDVCVYTGPCFAVLSTLLAFVYGQLISDSTLGCLFAAFVAFVPGMISRSMAGAYDYECIALFILVASFYTFSLALKTGSILYSILSAFCYGYMALTWGGYVFIANCIPLFVSGLVALGQYSWRLHITYSIWAVVGTLLSSSVPFINDKIIHSPEHFALIGVFVVIQVWGLFTFLKSVLSPASFAGTVVASVLALPLLLIAVITLGVSTGLLGGFSGRLLQMFDPSYATKNIPIIASVAEHHPSSWGMYFMDCGFLIIAFPLGCYFMLREGLSRETELQYLLLIYGMSTLYFGSIMVRLVLVFSPAMALVAAYGIHRLSRAVVRRRDSLASVALLTVAGIGLLTVLHSVWFSCYSYSGDHITFWIRTPRGQESSDDYREGYRWLWENTGRDDRVMSWWDYGYQITSMGGRGCHADGNTNNFTHIGIIGSTMSSPEAVSWRLARMMEADYMLVIFGGAAGYDGDDINKFLWMPKIANQTFTNISGDMYVGSQYEALVGPGMKHNMTGSMMFRFCYHNFKRFQFHPSVAVGTDLMRGVAVPNLDIRLTHFQEAFTTKNWIVRIYRVLPDPIWDRVY
jgi:dolichyl-diphosphooligosaccharide--protein glycosyltransferase